LKLMTPDHMASESSRKQFEREAQAVAQLHNPNVVQIFDYGLDDGWPYIVLELLEGEDLETRLSRQKALPTAQVASLLAQAPRSPRGYLVARRRPVPAAHRPVPGHGGDARRPARADLHRPGAAAVVGRAVADARDRPVLRARAGAGSRAPFPVGGGDGGRALG